MPRAYILLFASTELGSKPSDNTYLATIYCLLYWDNNVLIANWYFTLFATRKQALQSYVPVTQLVNALLLVTQFTCGYCCAERHQNVRHFRCSYANETGGVGLVVRRARTTGETI